MAVLKDGASVGRLGARGGGECGEAPVEIGGSCVAMGVPMMMSRRWCVAAEGVSRDGNTLRGDGGGWGGLARGGCGLRFVAVAVGAS